MEPRDPSSPTHIDRGARHFRADLQVHTPSDRRWNGPRGDDADSRAAIALEYLRAAQSRGIELVGITEHRGEVRAHGPIDDRAVRTAAEQILEGGEEAFRRRREKYGW